MTPETGDDGVTTLDRPRDFDGTLEEIRENRETHRWAAYDDEVVCARCDASNWSVAADYPCGIDPPREIITYPEG